MSMVTHCAYALMLMSSMVLVLVLVDVEVSVFLGGRSDGVSLPKTWSFIGA